MTTDFPRRANGSFGGLEPGSRIAGYLVEEQIGAGGMAVVFRARDELLGRLAAVKVIAPPMANDPEFRARFLRESRAVAAVDSLHIIPVYGAGEAEGLLYIATRFVAGGDLAALMRKSGGALVPARALSLVEQVASALDAAHAAGLMHRDVKPQNILVDSVPERAEHAFLCDFGLSKATDSATSLTVPGQFVGTPDYCAPEQIISVGVAGPTDQYALGCVAFVLLTGALPFRRDDFMATLHAHVHDPVPLLTELRPELPRAVDDVIARALAKSPADRYGRCGEFAAALREALVPPSSRFPRPPVVSLALPLDPRPGKTPTVPEGGGTGNTVAVGDDNASGPNRPVSGGRRRQPRRRNRQMALIGGTVAVLLAAAGITYAVLPSGAASQPPARPSKPALAETLTVPNGGTVNTVWFSPDGKFMAAADVVGSKIYIWNTVSRSYVTTITVPDLALTRSDIRTPAIANVAFNDADTSVTAVVFPHTGGADPAPYPIEDPDNIFQGDRPYTVYQWDLASGKRTTNAVIPADPGTLVLFSRDNSVVALTTSAVDPEGTIADTVRMVSLAPTAGGKPLHTITITSDPWTMDQTGSRILSTDNDGQDITYIWDVATGTMVSKIDGVYGNEFISPDGKTILMLPGTPGSAMLWDIATNSDIAPADPRWKQQLPETNDDSFSSDGSVLVTVRPGGSMDLWSTVTGKYLLTITDPNYREDSGYAVVGPGGSEAAIFGSEPDSKVLAFRQIQLWETPLSPPQVTAGSVSATS